MTDYHKRPEWSYSSMKKILDSGIDYAVAAKIGILEQPISPYIDLGQLVHMIVLGGDDTFAISEFPDFRTKAARQWRDEQIAAGKNIVTADQFKAASHIIKNIEDHPHSDKYLLGDGWRHEVEMYAKTGEGVALRGKADGLRVADGCLTVGDLKTTAQFDRFRRSAMRMHYDLQAAVYTMVASASQKIEHGACNYYICVAETVTPYRVQYFQANIDFLDAGERKLRTCIDEIVKFGNKEPTFLLTEVGELGDWSI